MQPHHTLERKFNPIVFKGSSDSTVPVSSSLQQFLQNESFRIQRLLYKKQVHESKLKRIESTNLSYRNNLKQKIFSEQKKHEQNRSKFLEKKSKRQNFKINLVKKRRDQLEERANEKEKSQKILYDEMRTQNDTFWKNRESERRKRDRSQSSASPSYEDAVQRKSFLKLRNQSYGDLVKNEVLIKHQKIKQRRQELVKDKQIILDIHKAQVEKTLSKHSSIKNSQENRIINNICIHQNRSSSLQKLNNKSWKDKLEKRLKFTQENFYRKKQNMQSRQHARAQSMANCRCHSKGMGSERLTESRNLNEEDDIAISKSNKKIENMNRNYSTLSMRKSFMMKSSMHKDIVRMNNEYLSYKKDQQDEKKLMRDRQISDALNIRNSMKNESNCLVRKARVLPTAK